MPPKNALPFFFIRYHADRTIDQMQNWLWHVNYYIDQIRWHLRLLHDCTDSDPVFAAFPMNPESCTKYSGCEYHPFCTAWPNPLRKATTVPIGYKRKFWDPLSEDERPIKYELNPEMTP